MEEREGKDTKVPYRLDGRRASSTNPDDWTGFPEACAYLLRMRDADGLGFRLGEGWAGVDMDKVRDPKTNTIQPWALDVIELLDSYSEISPSLTGFKVFCRGSLPPGRRRVGKLDDYMGTQLAGLETYDEGRYFTVTGLGVAPGALEDRTAALGRFHALYLPKEPEPTPSAPQRAPMGSDAELLEKMRQAKNGWKFWSLYQGDVSMHGSDDSSADLALVAEIAFWTQDEGQIDRLFRGSKLYRPKWDEMHGERTYGAMTIAKALSGGQKTYSPHRRESVGGIGIL